jgi:membrane protein YdbS with pleckstrin-like domain
VTAVLKTNVKPQAISGVSAAGEAEITTAYPSVASTLTGQRVGRLCDWLPVKTNGVPWPRLLIALPFWIVVVPVSLVVSLTLYAFVKFFGKRYILTNRSLQVRQMIGLRTFAEVPLTGIDQIAIQELPGQGYYKAADIVVLGTDGKLLVRLEGVQRADVFRHTILEARDARREVAESLKTIQSRKH